MSHQQYPSLSLEPTVEADSTAGAMNIKAYELKGFMFSMLTMCLKLTDIDAIQQQLTKEVAKLPEFFRDPLVLDLQDAPASDSLPDFPALLAMMRQFELTPIGICNGSEALQAAARAAGIPVLQGGAATKRRPATTGAKTQETSPPQSDPAPTAAPASREAPTTHIVDAPVRTGQRIFSNGDLTLLASVSPGAEVLAAGSIHVYGPLRGRALAGVAGDRKARIFTRSMEAELVSIAGSFRVLENDLGPDVQGKPVQIYLDGERVVIKPL